MGRYILFRAAASVPVLIGITIIVFVILSLIPGDPATAILGSYATPENVARLNAQLGLDRPLVQRYFIWLGNLLQGDLGRSFSLNRPVIDEILERFNATLILSGLAFVMCSVLGILAGVISATRQYGLADKLITFSVLVGISVPSFFLGMMMILGVAVNLRWLPVSGRAGFTSEVEPITHLLLLDSLLRGRLDAFWDALRHIILPAITLGLPVASILMRVTRASMLDVLDRDYITFAQAKGLTKTQVLFKHALKNALIPTVTVAALQTGALLGGNMVVETVFGWPGLGRLVVESIFVRNYPLIQAAVMLYAFTYVTLNFIADILYTILNPKVRL